MILNCQLEEMIPNPIQQPTPHVEFKVPKIRPRGLASEIK